MLKTFRYNEIKSVSGHAECSRMTRPPKTSRLYTLIMHSIRFLQGACRPSHSARLLARCNHTQNTLPSGGASQSHRTTHFGFQTVPEESKEHLVRGVFESVAPSYDLMNDAMSLGVHRLWKDDFVARLKPGAKGPIKCIDVAGGTGDIALRILDFARERYADRETSVHVADINPEMLKEGFKRFKKTMYHNSTCLSSKRHITY